MRASAIFVDNGCAYLATIDDGIFRSCALDFSLSIGSGEDYAISAIDLGKSAKKAVEYAMTRDSCSGGKVHVYDIVKGKFI